MNEIQRLIHEMCPDGVPMVALGEIGSLIRGNGLQKKDFVDQGIGCIHYGQIYTRFGLFTDKTLAYVSESLANKLTPVESGNLVIACTSENVEDVCKCVVWLGDKTIVTGGHAVVFKHSQNPKYIAYCFTTEDFQMQKRKYAFGAKVIDIKIDKLASIQIPLPPLPIQQRIVEILDKFTSLVSSLDSEIALRQKQYEYYRNKLLSFEEGDEGVEWKTIGEIGELVRGNGLQKTDFTDKGVGCIHYGQIYTRLGFSLDKTLSFVSQELASKLTAVESGNLVIACTSENVEDVCKSVVWLGSENIVTGGHACVLKHQEDPKYIGYCFLTNNFFIQKRKYAYGAKVIDIKTEKLALIKLPIPPIDKQLSIVRTLDLFESLLTNLKKERELRQKQYEYYREKLLTFA